MVMSNAVLMHSPSVGFDIVKGLSKGFRRAQEGP